MKGVSAEGRPRSKKVLQEGGEVGGVAVGGAVRGNQAEKRQASQRQCAKETGELTEGTRRPLLGLGKLVVHTDRGEGAWRAVLGSFPQ